MTDERLDRILAADDALEPSSGFAASVMDAVRRQADEPPPLPFPWLRFSVGLAACLTLAAAGAAVAPRAESLARSIAAPFAAMGPALGCAALAVVVSIGLAQLLPRVFARG